MNDSEIEPRDAVEASKPNRTGDVVVMALVIFGIMLLQTLFAPGRGST